MRTTFIALSFCSIFLLFTLLEHIQERVSPQTGGEIVKEASSENVLRFDTPYPLKSLRPQDPTTGSALIMPLFYSYLFVLNDQGELEPDLATRWSYNADKLSWTIVIRRDALWHDGARVTAEDVRYSLIDNAQQHFHGRFDLVAGVDVLSDDTFSIVLKSDEPAFPYLIWNVWIVREPRGKETERRHEPIGSGPYRLEYREGEGEVGLVANKHYYGGRPAIERIVFSFEPDQRRSWERLLAGQADIVWEIGASDYARIAPYEDRFYLNKKILRKYSILLYNTGIPQFMDPRVRLALSYAVDKETIVERYLNGNAVVAAGFIASDSPFHNPEVKPIPYDPEAALALLAEAGWYLSPEDGRLYNNGRRFEFTLLVSKGNQDEQRICEHLRICFKQVGIDMHIQAVPLDQASLLISNGSFQAILGELTGGLWTGSMLRYTEHALKSIWCPGGSKRKAMIGGFEDNLVTELFSKALQESDLSRKRELYRQLDSRIASLQPGTFLYHRVQHSAMSRRVHYPFPFGLEEYNIHRLWRASIKPAEDQSISTLPAGGPN